MTVAIVLLGLAVLALAFALVHVDRRHTRVTAALARAIRKHASRLDTGIADVAIELADVKRAIDRTLGDTAPISIDDIPRPMELSK